MAAEAGPCPTWEKLTVPADTACTTRFPAFPSFCSSQMLAQPCAKAGSSSGMRELRVMVGQAPGTCLYQHTLCQWLPGGASKCKADVHLSSCHLATFSALSQCLPPSHSHQDEEKTSPQLLPSGFTFLHLPPAHDVSVYKFYKKTKFTYFVSFIFTYHVYVSVSLPPVTAFPSTCFSLFFCGAVGVLPVSQPQTGKFS